MKKNNLTTNRMWKNEYVAANVVWRLKCLSGKGLGFDALLAIFGGNGAKSNGVKRKDLVRDNLGKTVRVTETLENGGVDYRVMQPSRESLTICAPTSQRPYVNPIMWSNNMQAVTDLNNRDAHSVRRVISHRSTIKIYVSREL
ncbi:hypothetical protein Tco_0598147 [Tanacetum coccineum]